MEILRDAAKRFGVNSIGSHDMYRAIDRWLDILRNRPQWADGEDDIRTLGMGAFIADTRAKLALLGVSVTSTNERVNDMVDDLMDRLSVFMVDAEALGGVIVKWNGVDWDIVMPYDFVVTETDSNGHINGAIFAETVNVNGEEFARLEYHRFIKDEYVVDNKAFRVRHVKDKTLLGDEIPLSRVSDWAEINPQTHIMDLDRPLFAYLRIPGRNHIDERSPLGLSCFAGAIEEMRMFDIAVSRKNTEIEDSKHMTFVGQTVIKSAQNPKTRLKLPRFVRGLGIGASDDEVNAIREHVPTMLTESRLRDINFDLSMLGIKCGFSSGMFVMDAQRGMVTATQVEADDRDTVQTVKRDRDIIKRAISDAVYGATVLEELSGRDCGEYELVFNFGDITYNYSEDRESWKQYVQNGWVPAWMYLVKFEGMTAEEAKAATAEASGIQSAMLERELLGME